LGRAIRQHYPNARIDFVDRDPLLMSICRAFNSRAGLAGTYRQLDLNDASWCQGMATHYDVIAAANAIHWLSAARAAAVFGDIYGLLDDGGTLLFAEPASPDVPFAPGLDEWKAHQPARYEQANWKAFWGPSELVSRLRPHRSTGHSGGQSRRRWDDRPRLD
jgi:hypothetical protein